MIIDFTITNFRSIRDEQTLSLFAPKIGDHLPNNVVETNISKINVLRTAGIYGANASGKSNLLQAFQALRYIICESGDLKEGDKIKCYEPYLLSKTTKDAPTSFEIEFIAPDKLRYLYSVSFNAKRIVAESLDFYPSRAPANLFKRSEDDTWDTITFGNYLKGGKKRFAFFSNNSYLSKAGNSADAPNFIRNIYNFFRQDINLIKANQNTSLEVLHWKEDEALVKDISNVLTKVDSGISSMNVKEQDISDIKLPDNMPDQFKKIILEHESKQPIFFHEGSEGHQEEFTEAMESDGTQKLVNMLPFLIMVLNEGDIVLLDELDVHFHPHISELIIKLFHDPKVNKNNAQFIFTTHNINLMSPELMRRDQIWLTEKTQGETKLFSLDEFDKSMVKKDSPFHKWYDNGRFGAIPKIDIDAIAKIIIDRVQ